MPRLHNPLFVEYVLVCTHPGCIGRRTIEQAESAGWRVGDIIPEDSTHPDVGRCIVCKRHKMKVVKAPEPPVPPGPKGWTRIPTE